MNILTKIVFKSIGLLQFGFIKKVIFSILDKVANKTENEIDNAFIASLATLFREKTKNAAYFEVSKLVKELNDNKILSDRGIRFNFDVNKSVGIESKLGNVLYEYKGPEGKIIWSTPKDKPIPQSLTSKAHKVKTYKAKKDKKR
jgi:hypothetical protein